MLVWYVFMKPDNRSTLFNEIYTGNTASQTKTLLISTRILQCKYKFQFNCCSFKKAHNQPLFFVRTWCTPILVSSVSVWPAVDCPPSLSGVVPSLHGGETKSYSRENESYVGVKSCTHRLTTVVLSRRWKLDRKSCRHFWHANFSKKIIGGSSEDTYLSYKFNFARSVFAL